MGLQILVHPWKQANIDIPAGHEEIAIGDSHGCADQLDMILAKISELMRDDGTRNLTFLGDLVDRGPSSLKCMDLAASAGERLKIDTTMLLGNHESMMLAAFNKLKNHVDKYHQEEAGGCWARNGGWVVVNEMRDYMDFCGISPNHGNEWMKGVPAKSRNFIENYQTHRKIGNLLLCHAGINPNFPIDSWFNGAPWPVSNEDLSWCWVREPFLETTDNFENNTIVVHGHTFETLARKMRYPRGHAKDIRTGPDSLRNISSLHELDINRIGLDGGSYDTSVVAAAQFRRGQYRVITVGNPETAAHRAGIIWE